MSGESLRVGIAGCGRIAPAHAGALDAGAGVELGAAADPDPAARQAAADEWAVPVFESAARMLESTELDAVCVCAPPAFHAEITRTALQAGAHVLCEKPGATKPGVLASLVREARDAGRVLLVSSKFSFVEDLREAAGLIEAGSIGDPLAYRIRFCTAVSEAEGWHTRPEVSGGGVVMDNATHAWDVLEAAGASPPSRVTSLLQSDGGDGGRVEHTAEILARLEDGGLGQITLSWRTETDSLRYLLVQGTRGTLRVGWTGGGWRPHGESDWREFGRGYDKAAAFRRQLRAFRSWIESGERSPELPDPVDRLRFIDAVYRAGTDPTWCDLPHGPREAAPSAPPGAAAS